MRWTEYAVAMLLFSVVSMLLLYLMQRMQLHLPFNPQKLAASDARAPGVQHRRFVHHEYQLAGLFGREHDELLHPDGRSCLPQLHFRCDGHRAGDRLHSRHRPPADADHRQLLGGHGARLPVGVAAVLHHRRAAAGFAGRGAEPEAVRHGEAGRAAAGAACRMPMASPRSMPAASR